MAPTVLWPPTYYTAAKHFDALMYHDFCCIFNPRLCFGLAWCIRAASSRFLLLLNFFLSLSAFLFALKVYHGHLISDDWVLGDNLTPV